VTRRPLRTAAGTRGLPGVHVGRRSGAGGDGGRLAARMGGGADEASLGPAGQDDRLLRAGHGRSGGAGRGRGGRDRAAAAGGADRPGHPGAADRQRLRRHRHEVQCQVRPAADRPSAAARPSAGVAAWPGPEVRRRHRRRHPRPSPARQTAGGPGGAAAGP
jgi:hypothetical protein